MPFSRRTITAIRLTTDSTIFLGKTIFSPCSNDWSIALTLRLLKLYVLWQCSHWSLLLLEWDGMLKIWDSIAKNLLSFQLHWSIRSRQFALLWWWGWLLTCCCSLLCPGSIDQSNVENNISQLSTKIFQISLWKWKKLSKKQKFPRRKSIEWHLSEKIDRWEADWVHE